MPPDWRANEDSIIFRHQGGFRQVGDLGAQVLISFFFDAVAVVVRVGIVGFGGSAPVSFAICSATALVLPVTEKYTTSGFPEGRFFSSFASLQEPGKTSVDINNEVNSQVFIYFYCGN